MKRTLLDTCILIDYLRGKPEAILFLDQLNHSQFLSTMTLAELYAGVREGEERTALDEFIKTFQIAPVNDAIAKQGGLYQRKYYKSHGTDLVDAVIAATGETLDAELVTLNKKHFPMFPNLLVPS